MIQITDKKEDFIIKPHIRYIYNFQLKKLNIPLKKDNLIESLKNIKLEYSKSKIEYNSYIAKFPIIIKEDGKIWELANLYLILYMITSNEITGSTLKAIAIDLLDYYKFLNERNIDIFHFPQLNRYRATYQYRNYLLDQVYENKYHKSTASRRINRIVDFYERLLKNEYISKEYFENEPYERIIKRITLNNTLGFEFQKIIKSTNLAIRQPKRNIEYDVIHDGGSLKPLTDSQQKIFLEYLERFGNRQLQLICLISLLTGARIQTIGTLKVYHLKELLKKLKENQNIKTHILHTGLNTGIDTKHNKPLNLYFPKNLIISLENYINSKIWYQRALKSFYGITDKNYIFITKSGLPYYTSKLEILDIKNSNGQKIVMRNGEAIRKNLEELIKKIKEDHSNFRVFKFHDLRATFGMNYLKLLLKRNLNKDQCLLLLKEVMGHNNVATTLNYLNYQEIIDQFSTAQEELENKIFGSMLND
ncbi:tyrosine-type recombinase/integrase [Acinetobacter pittii]|uniref:hypothetical protein n=1 Tax=Acinetobacter pittii TaxID=48296 RepID=UPI002DBB3B5B|nr:hypothetical protein [Acinetobacter pittii]MEB6625380.1 tyrosine-type recombinase/integrase [Acinetobacter pittii]